VEKQIKTDMENAVFLFPCLALYIVELDGKAKL